MALRMLSKNQVSLYDKSDENLILRDVVVSDKIIMEMTFVRDWEKKRDDAHYLGRNTSMVFSNNILMLFPLGETDKGKNTVRR